MEYIKKYKWALTGFIIMLVLNIGTLASLWLLRPPAPGSDGRMPDHAMVHRYMVRELDLNEDQKEQFRRMRENHRKEASVLAESLRNSRREYFEALTFPEPDSDSAKVDSLARQLAKNYVQMESTMFRHLSELKDILNEDQKEIFSRITRNSLFRHRRPGGPAMQQRMGNPDY